jgi:excisionase family DNA binding protein
MPANIIASENEQPITRVELAAFVGRMLTRYFAEHRRKPIWVSVRVAAELCGVSLTKMRKMIDAGLVEYTDVGHKRLVKVASLEALGETLAK